MAGQSTLLSPISVSGAVADLAEDRLTSWVPDVVADADLPQLDAAAPISCDPEVRMLKVPLPGGGAMQVPVVHPRLLVALHEVAVMLREDAQTLLAPGVLGYRSGAEHNWHYAPAWRTFSDATASQASQSGWVAFTDVTSFFRSTSWQMVADAISPYASPRAVSELHSVSRRFLAAGLEYLPSGYSDARFLSNLVLASADEVIGVPFVRWVDDYRLFAETYEEATTALARLHGALRLAGFEPNDRKTRIVSGSDAAAQHRNTLASVYHPDRDPPDLVRRNLHRVFWAAAEDPIGRRRDLRFSLSARTGARSHWG